MAMFGSSWLDDESDDSNSGSIFSHWRDESSFDYFRTEEGEYKQIRTKRERRDAEQDNNVFSFDGNNYSRKI